MVPLSSSGPAGATVVPLPPGETGLPEPSFVERTLRPILPQARPAGTRETRAFEHPDASWPERGRQGSRQGRGDSSRATSQNPRGVPARRICFLFALCHTPFNSQKAIPTRSRMMRLGLRKHFNRGRIFRLDSHSRIYSRSRKQMAGRWVRAIRKSATRRVILVSPQTVPHLHTIYTDQLVFPVAGSVTSSAFFRPHPTNFIMCDVELRTFSSTLTIRARSLYFKQSSRTKGNERSCSQRPQGKFLYHRE
jgi:hypothetical protein